MVEAMLAYLDSLILDVENDEYDFRETKTEEVPAMQLTQTEKPKNKVFIVHGHDGEAKERTAPIYREARF